MSKEIKLSPDAIARLAYAMSRCTARHPSGWWCELAAGHAGDHAAALGKYRWCMA